MFAKTLIQFKSTHYRFWYLFNVMLAENNSKVPFITPMLEFIYMLIKVDFHIAIHEHWFCIPIKCVELLRVINLTLWFTLNETALYQLVFLCLTSLALHFLKKPTLRLQSADLVSVKRGIWLGTLLVVNALTFILLISPGYDVTVDQQNCLDTVFCTITYLHT